MTDCFTLSDITRHFPDLETERAFQLRDIFNLQVEENFQKETKWRDLERDSLKAECGKLRAHEVYLKEQCKINWQAFLKSEAQLTRAMGLIEKIKDGPGNRGITWERWCRDLSRDFLAKPPAPALVEVPKALRDSLLPHAILHMVAAGSQLCKDKPDFVLTPAVAAVLREYLDTHQEET